MADEGALSGVGEVDYEDYLFELRFGMPRAQYEQEQGTIENSITPTRDKLNLFLEENTPFNENQIGNMMGGQGRGFLDMGLSDITFIPALADSYDAYNRLRKKEKTDNFSDSEQSVITNSPFILKVAGILSGEFGNKNIISDYYDGKKTDITTAYAGPLGFLGLKAGALKFLSKFKKGAMYK
tara:strand:- start:32 stop:577 length:546 start_codon:yes stop_codon:yes gene_type:complete